MTTTLLALALDAPPLHRPELPELLPTGYQDPFRVVMEKRSDVLL